jgi:hypothetical protein
MDGRCNILKCYLLANNRIFVALVTPLRSGIDVEIGHVLESVPRNCFEIE